MPRSLVIVFAKAPRPGFVKTRIAEKVGDEFAASVSSFLYLQVASALIEMQQVEFRITPDDSKSEFPQRLWDSWTQEPQGGGDLGLRLVRAFAEAFLRGVERVAIIGSDCPDFTEEDIHEAWEELDSHDVVIGPAKDGGYWLIALKEQHPELFAGIAWSSPSVLAQTRAIAEGQGMKVKLLRELSDIDTFEDWQAYMARQAQRGSRRPRRR